ncbi:hypothetical protein EWM64_g8349 [Hericium alpestre]|uniref:BTB domain-containing protein n=1 Tax=Hericium alpestre TaxID=135208 RepID=A0A4Y9ZLL9_9AGAM|nr:hypothetical protein EWM64_g8349 [Hericium alpestre]
MSNSTGTLPPSSSPQDPRLADEPFNDTAADVILRTSDQVNFYVCRYILSLASPFFKDMFSLPQPARAAEKSIEEDPTASHAVIDVSEDSRTLDFVLRFCYPMRKPIMTELKDVAPVLLSACKYDMDAVLDVAKIALEQCIEQDTPGVFALACRCELYDVCSKAAEEFVQRPFLSLESKELDHITALQYHLLLEYHQRYAKDDSRSCPLKHGLKAVRGTATFIPRIVHYTTFRFFASILSSEAGTPFDDKNADVVLRSSDQAAFHVHSFILSLASPIFKEMILDHQQVLMSETRPVGDEAKLSPIINVSEDSDTLNVFLRCCYPVRLPRLTQLSEARVVLAAGLKYDVDAVKALAEAALMEFVDNDILGQGGSCTILGSRFIRRS